MAYDREQIQSIVETQRAFFRSGGTLDVAWRKEQLKKLKAAVQRFEPQLKEALAEDLGRSEAEAFFCDIGSVILEINENIAGVRRWSRPETHFSGFTCFPSVVTKVYKMPYGTALIISPFNFPVLLALGPLVASIAGGNTAVIKASSKSPACTKVLQQLIAETFPPSTAPSLTAVTTWRTSAWSSASTRSSTPARPRSAGTSWRWPRRTWLP